METEMESLREDIQSSASALGRAPEPTQQRGPEASAFQGLLVGLTLGLLIWAVSALLWWML